LRHCERWPRNVWNWDT